MVWTTSPLTRTIAISLLSPRERSNATRSPAGDHTGFESLRPRAMGTSGRTNSGSIPAGSPAAGGSSAAAGKATAGHADATSKASEKRQVCIAFGPARLLFLDLIAVSARPLASLHEGRIALELFREEVEVFSPREARAVHHRRLLRHQIQLVVRERRVVVSVVHRFVVLRAREEARVLPGGLQRLDRLGELAGCGVAIARHQAVAFLAIRMAEVGEGDRELLVDELLVLRQRQHGLELGDRGVVVLLVVEVDVAQAPARLGVIRVLAAGGGIGLDGAVDVAFLARALAELEEILLQHDAALAGAVLLLLGELHDLEEVAVVLAVGQAHAVKAERDRLAAGERRLADRLVVDVDARLRGLGVDLEQGIVGRQHEHARLAALVDADPAGDLLVAMAVQQERVVAAEPQGDLRLAVGPGRAFPLAVQVDVGACKRVDVGADAALRGEQEVGALIAPLAFARSHHAIADLYFLAFFERGDLGKRARVVAALDLHPAGLAVARHLAALGEGRRGQRELGAAADAPVPADVDAIALVLHGDHRALEREALDDVVHDLAYRAVDAAGAAGARDLRENDLAARGVEFGLGQIAVIVLGDAAEHDHVHARTQRRVLPALGDDALDAELALLDLGLQPLRWHFAEPRELEQLRRERLLGLGRDLRQVHPRGVADDAVDADADRLGRGRVEVALQVDRTFKPDRGLPRRGDIARRRERDHGLVARRAAVGVRISALRVGLAYDIAVYAHAQPRHPACPAVLVGQRLDRHHCLAVEREFDHLARLELAHCAVGAVPGLGDAELGSLRRLLPIDVHDLALVIGDARLRSPDRDLGPGHRRVLLAHAKGHVAHGLEIGVEAVRGGLAVLRQLHQDGRFPRLDAVAGHLLAHRHVDLGARLLADLLREHRSEEHTSEL